MKKMFTLLVGLIAAATMHMATAQEKAVPAELTNYAKFEKRLSKTTIDNVTYLYPRGYHLMWDMIEDQYGVSAGGHYPQAEDGQTVIYFRDKDDVLRVTPLRCYVYDVEEVEKVTIPATVGIYIKKDDNSIPKHGFVADFAVSGPIELDSRYYGDNRILGESLNTKLIKELTVDVSRWPSLHKEAFHDLGGVKKLTLIENQRSELMPGYVLDTINRDIVKGDSLEQVTIVAYNVDMIKQFAFDKVRKTLKSLSIETSKHFSMADALLKSAPALESVKLQLTGEKPAERFNISDKAFAECLKLKEIRLAGVDTIGEAAFMNCTALDNLQLYGVGLVPTLRVIGPHAFDGAKLGNSLFFGDKTAYENLEKIDTRAFANTNIESVTFSGYKRRIDVNNEIFYNCKKLKTLIFTMSSLEHYLAAEGATTYIANNCPALTSISAYSAEPGFYLGGKVFSEQAYPWYNRREQITSFTWRGPYSGWIPNYLFKGMSALQTLDIVSPLGGELRCGVESFAGSHLTQLPYRVRQAAEKAFYQSKLQQVEIAPGTTENPTVIENLSFSETALKSVSFPDGVYTIYESAFRNNSQLTTFDMSKVKQQFTGVSHKYIADGTEFKAADNAYTSYPNTIPALLCRGCRLLTLSLPKATTNIMTAAFAGNSLSYIFIPDEVTEVGLSAFAPAEVTAKRTVRVGKKVTKLDEYAFGYSGNKSKAETQRLIWLNDQWNNGSIVKIFPKIEALELTDGGVYCETIPDFLCDGCASITSVTFADDTKRIGEFAFAGLKNLKSVKIPFFCEEIGRSAFLDASSLSQIIISEQCRLKKIGSWAFGSASFTGPFVLPENLEIVDFLALPMKLTSVEYYAKNLKSSRPFIATLNLKEVNIREGVESLPDSLLTNTYVTQMTIPSTVKRLGRQMLAGVQTLDGNTFRIYYNAKNATFEPYEKFGKNRPSEDHTKAHYFSPWGVDHVNKVVNNLAYYEDFSGYSEKILETKFDLVIGSIVESLPDFFFAGLKMHRRSYTLPEHVKKAGKFAFYNTDIQSLTAEGLETADEHAFYFSDSLRRATLPNLKAVAPYAFRHCRNLTSADIRSAQEIGEEAFVNCDKLTSVKTGESLVTIGKWAFHNCYTLSDGLIPRFAQVIGDSAFFDTEIRDVTMQNVRKMGTGVFAKASLKKMHLDFLTAVPETNEHTFDGITPGNVTVTANCDLIPLLEADDNWKDFDIQGYGSRYLSIVPAPDPKEGSVSVSVPGCDNVVRVEAQPAKFYTFKQWSDGSTENPREITLTEDMSLGVEFEKTGDYVKKYFRFEFSTPDGATFSKDPSGWYVIDYEVAYEYPIYDINVFTNEHFRIDFNESLMPRDTKGNILPDAPTLMCTSDEGVVNCTSATLAFDYADKEAIMNAQTDTIVITIPLIGENVRLSDVLQSSDADMGGLYYYYDKEDYNYKMHGIAEGDMVPYGSEVTVFAHPNTGHDFIGWDDDVTDEIRTFTIGEEIHKAIFEPQEFLVTFSVSEPEYAALLAWGEEYKYFEQTYSYGEAVDLLPDEYIQVLEAAGSFDHWEVNGKVAEIEVIEDDWLGPYPYLKDPITEDLNIVAVIKLNEMNIQASPSDGKMGTVALSGEAPHLYGDQVTLTATPASEHYLFTGWSDGINDNPREVTLTSDTVITALFEPVKYNVSLTILPEGAAVAEGAGEYAYGTDYTLTLDPKEGYELKEWRDGEALDNKTNTLTGFVYGDVHIEAVLQLKKFTITTSVNDEEKGAVTGAGTYDYGTAVTLKAVPAASMIFVGWEDDPSAPAERTVTVRENASYKALFEPETVSITVLSSNNAFGSVVTNMETTNVAVGTQIALAAVPNTGYRFTMWSDAIKENPRTITATADLTLMAVFAPEVFTVTVGDYDKTMGSVAIDGSEYEYLDYAHLVATPNEGYEFKGWDNGETEDDIYVLVDGDIVITPVFAKKTGTALDEAEAAKLGGSTKILRDGVLYIITPDGAVFNARGQRVK